MDRKNKNNQSLFRGTFERELATLFSLIRSQADSSPLDTVMALGESIGVFPEGTSHTSPHMLPLKDGISWAALEYLSFLNGNADGVKRKGRKVQIVPVGITYKDKSKYRSRIVVE